MKGSDKLGGNSELREGPAVSTERYSLRAIELNAAQGNPLRDLYSLPLDIVQAFVAAVRAGQAFAEILQHEQERRLAAKDLATSVEDLERISEESTTRVRATRQAWYAALARFTD